MSITTVLITGTSSGLGLELLRRYSESGAQIVAVNRRDLPEQEREFPRAIFLKGNITSIAEVRGWLGSLALRKIEPELFLLNAGIDLEDIHPRFDLEALRSVWQCNFEGVLTFVHCIQELGLTNKRIVAISSMAMLAPNNRHVGYYLSKRALFESFRLIALYDPANHYKVFVPGPLTTRMGAASPRLGIAKVVGEMLAVSAASAADKCFAFATSRKRIQYYPPTAYFFFRLAGRFVARKRHANLGPSP